MIYSKVVFVGEYNVGKTAILDRFTGNYFTDQPEYIAIEPIYCKTLQIDDENIKLQLCDTANLEKYTHLPKTYYRGALGVILVFDITERSTFEKLNNWIKDIKSFLDPNVSIILVGNKKDLEMNRQVSENEALEFAQNNNFQYIEASAKTKFHITDIFLLLGREIIRKNKDLILKEQQQNTNNEKNQSKGFFSFLSFGRNNIFI